MNQVVSAKMRPSEAKNKVRHGHGAILRRDLSSEIRRIKAGYSIDDLEAIKNEFGVTLEKLAGVANITISTLHRRKKAHRFTAVESDRMYRLEKLYATALEVLETKENVTTWFSTPQRVFSNTTPFEFAGTQPGAEQVEKVLRRIEHGIAL